MSRLKLVPFVLALAASLVVASAASAKGGGGGGGGGGTTTCVQIRDFSVTAGVDASGAPTYTTSYVVDNNCVDERMSSAALGYTNLTTGFVGRAVTMLSYGTNTLSRTAPGVAGQTLAITLTVYAPNGKIGGTSTQTVTFPAA
jgi:hypothetical protein